MLPINHIIGLGMINWQVSECFHWPKVHWQFRISKLIDDFVKIFILLNWWQTFCQCSFCRFYSQGYFSLNFTFILPFYQYPVISIFLGVGLGVSGPSDLFWYWQNVIDKMKGDPFESAIQISTAHWLNENKTHHVSKYAKQMPLPNQIWTCVFQIRFGNCIVFYF